MSRGKVFCLLLLNKANTKIAKTYNFDIPNHGKIDINISSDTLVHKVYLYPSQEQVLESKLRAAENDLDVVTVYENDLIEEFCS